MTAHLQRAQLLIEQNRYADAERELGQSLAHSPDDAWTHALMALCLSRRDAHREASEHGRQAIAAAPDSAPIRHLIGRVELGRNDLDAAERVLTEAIQLDPDNDDAFSARAAVHAQRKHWRRSLEDVDRALAIDPENLEAINLRSLANRGLGRSGAGLDDMRAALEVDPNDASSHANLGWSHLERNQLNEAERHFREALRLDPSLEWARVGVLETIKAKFPVYRWVLAYFLWMAKLTGRAQMAIIVGLFFVNRAVRGAAEAYPEWAPVLMPVTYLYAAFCVMTWFIQPLGNATLLAHPFARMALNRREKTEALVVGGLFTLVVGLIIANAVTGSFAFLLLAVAIGIPALPLAMSFKFQHPKPWRIMLAVTGLVLLAEVGFMASFAIETGLIPPVGPPIEGLLRLSVMVFPLSPLGVLVLTNVLAAKNWRNG
ncbi:MAG: tetratricopeptide repeat protein [Planctomycetota bacterium]